MSVLPVVTARKRSLRRLCFHRCPSVFRGVCLIACWDAPPQADTSLGRHPPGQTPPRQTPPWADTPQLGRHPPAQCMLGYSQQAGGTHPTGMQSCFVLYLCSDRVDLTIGHHGSNLTRVNLKFF